MVSPAGGPKALVTVDRKAGLEVDGKEQVDKQKLNTAVVEATASTKPTTAATIADAMVAGAEAKRSVVAEGGNSVSLSGLKLKTGGRSAPTRGPAVEGADFTLHAPNLEPKLSAGESLPMVDMPDLNQAPGTPHKKGLWSSALSFFGLNAAKKTKVPEKIAVAEKTNVKVPETAAEVAQIADKLVASYNPNRSGARTALRDSVEALLEAHRNAVGEEKASIAKDLIRALDARQAAELKNVDETLFKEMQTLEPFPTMKDGSPIPFDKALRGVRTFMDDRLAVFEGLQRFERTVVERAIGKGIDLSTAREEVLKETEAAHGFPKPVDLQNKVYSSSQWWAMLASGTPFRDLKRDNDAHGRDTHRMQYYLVMKDAEANPERYGGSKSKPPDMRKTFQAMGDAKAIKQFDWPPGEKSKADLWMNLFDALGDTWRCPEWFRSTRDCWNLVGDWE